MIRLALPVLLLLGSIAVAQDKNAELRRDNEKLQARVAKLEKAVFSLEKALQAKDRRIAATQAELRKRIAEQKVNKAGAKVGVKVRRAQVLVRPNPRRFNRLSSTARRNPIVNGDYKKALDEWNAMQRKLGSIEDPKQAREHVDAMSRQLLEVRRALWELEKKKAPAAKRK